MILDVAKQNGTGMWTSQSGMELQVPIPTIDVAVTMRDLSVLVQERQQADRIYQRPLGLDISDHKKFLADLRFALYGGMLIAYAQGMSLLSVASEHFHYHLDLGTVAKIWRGGCIIRAALLDDIWAAYRTNSDLHNIMLDPKLSSVLNEHQEPLRKIISQAVALGIPTPARMSAISYLDAYRSALSPANLIQAQRDYFGAHTYERIDMKGTHSHRMGKIMTQLKRQPANPCVLVIFGIAGDLTKRLLYPAICNLGSKGLLDENFSIVGIAIEKYTTKSFRAQLRKDVKEFVTGAAAKKFGLSLRKHVHYLQGDFSDHKTYVALKKTLEKLEKEKVSRNYLFYLAIPPEFILKVATELQKVKLLAEKENEYFRRIVVEKPFGHDLDSAKSLNQALTSLVDEQQIFRIDHFLGKETVQNLLAFRFSNGIFEPIWNRRYIDNIQITVAETLGVELRGAYYEQAGALRDMAPNHLLQMLSLIALEPPISFSAEHIRDEKAKVLHTIPIYTPEQVLQRAVRGQYVGYRSEQHIATNSPSETYVALKLYIDNWRWLHVPFYLRTGKKMKARTSEIVIQFKSGPSSLFSGSEQDAIPNLLRIYIQPEEGISLHFNAKIPGPSMQLGAVDMKFKYKDYFGIKPETGYETILYDCMNGDNLLFNNAAMVEAGWAIVQPILDVWSALTPREFQNYEAGSWGPKQADDLVQQDGRIWLL